VDKLPFSRRGRRPLLALAVAATATIVPSAFAIGCSKAPDGGQADHASLVESDAAADADAAPRRVCPSAQRPDGGWLTIDGMDVSDYQYTDWDGVVRENPNMKFAFARVSAGLVRVDLRFSADWAGMKRVGLIRGAYQYFKPSQSAVAQADLFLQRLSQQGGLEARDLPPVLDIETTNGMPTATVQCRMKIWLARVGRATKRTPLIYSSAAHNTTLGADFGNFPLWISNYVGTPSRTCPRMPDSWNKWTMWQYSESARVRGVYSNGARDDDAGGVIALQDGGDGGPVLPGSDVNFFDGTLDDLEAYVASSAHDEPVDDPPALDDPPHVPSSDAGPPVDCSDGCCVVDP
jgi:GH25 family lysozyme M1 (1,4-beta-N-acetylmuramidase)